MEIAVASVLVMLLASSWVLVGYFQGRFSLLDPRDPTPEAPPRLSLPALVLVMLMVGEGLLALIRQTGPPTSLEISDLQNTVMNGGVISLLLVGALYITPGLSFKDYGFQWRAWHKQVALGGLAFLASLLPVYLSLLATSPFRSTETLHPFLKLLQNQPGGETIFWIGLAVTIAAPVVEELTYRVILQTSLAHWLPIGLALPLTALIFSAMHGWPDMLPLLPLALILGWVYYRHRSYLAIVTTHALFNAWMLAWAVLVPELG